MLIIALTFCVFLLLFFSGGNLYFSCHILWNQNRFKEVLEIKVLDKDSEVAILTERFIIKNMISQRMYCKCSLKHGRSFNYVNSLHSFYKTFRFENSQCASLWARLYICFWCKSGRIRRSGASKVFLKRRFFQVKSQTFHLQVGVVYYVCECGSGGGGGLDDSDNGG